MTTITAALAENPIAGVPASVPMITKGGLNAVTLSLAIEYAKQGIRFNAVAPGVVDTPMHQNDDKSLLKIFQPNGRTARGQGRSRRSDVSNRSSLCNRGGAARGRRCARGQMVSA